MNEDNFGFPDEADVFEEIAKGEQRITVVTDKRRYGKVITLVSGFDKGVDLKSVGKSLKEALACGGTVRDGTVELQGNHKKQVKKVLIGLGFQEDSIHDD